MKRVYQKTSDTEYKDITPNNLLYPQIGFLNFLKNNMEKYWNIKPLKITSIKLRYEILGFDYNYNRVVLFQFNDQPYHDLIRTRYHRMIFEDRWLHDCLGDRVNKINLEIEKINVQLSKLVVFRFNSNYENINSILVDTNYHFTTKILHPGKNGNPIETEVRSESVNYLGVEVWNVSNIKEEIYHIECLNDGSLILNDLKKVNLEKSLFNSFFVSNELTVIYYGLKEFLNLMFGVKNHVGIVRNYQESISKFDKTTLIQHEGGGYTFFEHDSLSNLDYKKILVLYFFYYQKSIGVNLILEFKNTNILVKLFFFDGGNNSSFENTYFGDYFFSTGSTYRDYFVFYKFLTTKLLEYSEELLRMKSE
jgi:hypothetical protein